MYLKEKWSSKVNEMSKYSQVFKISLQDEFVYRLNFVLWRLRNVFSIFLVFFLWDSIFSVQDRVIFGYDRVKILTYIFALMFVKAIVFASKTMDVTGEIARGDLSNSLLKPLDYFKYWLTRDVASKTLNLSFALVETTLLFLILKPPFFLQNNLISILLFIVSLLIAVALYFLILFIVSSSAFWVPEMGWAIHFIITIVILEFLSGSLFPLDVLPKPIFSILSFTPFYYLIFFPIEVYLGKISGGEAVRGILISFVWVVILYLLMRSIWQKGLKVYQAYGR
ncbi:hypothetical protein A3A76_04180 [Candidatus Woesebacteria bacterium RIFCSPLOWO2_01_FULL_39_23]|uniref:ABC-2 type transporter domain-containing protein n=1 Tax=Candidatus Woesebacteria bacterium RIFCSPHIGHO2_01_FULL_40_22 TaxID=1802499 RepID=A0A1F7YFK5_9BACT|nr:MAG: hypothetical protein A2141_01745 [Candidatus Woesebacteria bacterium RBG_16_40_11]OGM25950.1 MAG: hypothetical protein A2628_00180 [Candidatus Woesebacteria bacterium RIFCSPHIGHO2_01_FULL_40_22]OGM38063.1 MAG: hypothetical protein A3E41_03270 [Candidatus Woesebacteria bacterium RIFCSPHIGHO2_12_FULL_38_9]OGM61799.1 MAG: hypothetical protein A3A76_04180 [Candidatus Woesebacteria bacterium RIFCSPLOWO2_01_FULL_39_23]